MRRLFSLLALVALAGCGDAGSHVSTTTPKNLTRVGYTAYFLRDGKVAPVCRQVRTYKHPAAAAIEDLARGPTPSQRADGLTSAMPRRFGFQVSQTADEIAVNIAGTLDRRALAQVTYTLSDLGHGRDVVVAGKRYTPADFEDETPAILIQSPCAGSAVRRPVRVSGTANTFEATFVLELRTGGRVLVRKTVRASSGSGARGAFTTPLAYTVPEETRGELRAYELSAKDGTPVNIVTVPLSLLP